MIYFDHNATTPVDSRVLEVMLPFLQGFYGNPSSLYRLGRLARTAVDTARQQVASLVNVGPTQIIFTSGGTEANNLALRSAPKNRPIVISAIEHPSLTAPVDLLRQQGCEVLTVPVDGQGRVTQQDIEGLLPLQPGFVSIILANNETGVVQDVAKVASHFGVGTLFHTDAVQAVGKILVDFNQLGVQLMSLSSHKIYGPKGCGALVFTKDAPIIPLLIGGGQEQGFRAGTENVAAIVGFGKAAELAAAELASRTEKLLLLRQLLESQLALLGNVTVFSQDAVRLPNTVQFGIQGMDGEMLLMRLDQKGVAVSSGSACASGGAEPSPVLLAMGVGKGLAKSAIRVSLGVSNTEADILRLIDLLRQIIHT